MIVFFFEYIMRDDSFKKKIGENTKNQSVVIKNEYEEKNFKISCDS